MGSERALCQSTVFLRMARLEDVPRALWVQAHQDGRPCSQSLMVQGPCAKVSVSLASFLQSCQSPHISWLTLTATQTMDVRALQAQWLTRPPWERGGVPAFSEACQEHRMGVGLACSAQEVIYILIPALHINTPSEGVKSYHGDTPVACPECHSGQ